ncbi:hypothetical protein Pfo_003256 [Paulownia fortunei]|nr:hypothetical protein Pfo_003256 [Paulownia fortunei]
MSKYEGTGDPQKYLDRFYAKADLYDLSDAAHCKIFRTTLTKQALSWFNQLIGGTITIFEQFTQQGEPLCDCVKHFVEGVHEVPHINHELFKKSIAGKPPETLKELLQRVEKYIYIEEAMRLPTLEKRKQLDEKRPEGRNEERHHSPPNSYTRFALIQPPHPLRESSKRAKSDKYFCFHQNRGHTTEDYFYLKQEIERLIRKGYLIEFRHDRGGRENLPMAGVIVVISGGPGSGDSSNGRRALLRAASRELAFGEFDLEGRREQHNDALVISATLSNFWVKKILVDNRSSADIILYDAFLKLRIDNAQLSLMNTPLTEFGGEVVETLGEVALPFSLGSYPKRVTKMVKFLVVNTSLTYNMILERPSLNLFRAIASIYHMKLKFYISEGISEAIGDQRMARECYVNTLRKISTNLKRQEGGDDLPKKGKRKLVNSIDGDLKDRNKKPENMKLKVIEKLKIVELIHGNPPKTIKIGTGLDPEVKKHLSTFLRYNIDDLLGVWRN